MLVDVFDLRCLRRLVEVLISAVSGGVKVLIKVAQVVGKDSDQDGQLVS